MKFGLQVINAWSANDGVKNPSQFLLELAIAADKSGWDGFFLWDHLLFPWSVPIVESWTVLSAIAGITENLWLGTTVTPVARRRPHILAKQLATLDQLTNGKAVLGVGLGGLELEYTPFGEEFDYKMLAKKTDEALEVITGLWSGEQFTYNGKHYTVNNVTFLPKPIQEPHIPIWIGGSSRGATKRASKHDGWVIGGSCPSAKDAGLSLKQVSQEVRRIQKYRDDTKPFDVIYGMELPENESQLRKLILKADTVGVTWLCESIFGLRCTGGQALKIVNQGPPSHLR